MFQYKTEKQVIKAALKICEPKRGDSFTSPDVSDKFLTLKFHDVPNEQFAAIWMDNRNRMLKFEILFQGTIDGASVYPREVVRSALKHNAAAVIFSHNHPSGCAEPSRADENITRRLKDALALIDVRVLDHIIVGGNETVSFAKRGLI